MQQTTLLKPEHIIPIKNLYLRAKLIVEGMIAGIHRSPFHGFSSEFLEYRPYFQNQSMRYIDWRKYAKSDKTVVKVFEDETNLQANVLIDKSMSMAFQSKNVISKLDYAKALAASLSWILLAQKDSVGLAVFDESLEYVLPCKSSQVQLKNIISTLEKVLPENKTKCGQAIEMFASFLKRRGLCIILSDFFDSPDSLIRSLKHLRYKRQDIILLWILDPQEIHISEKNSYSFDDLESGERIFLDGITASKMFTLESNKHRSAINTACKELQIDIETVITNEPFQRVLLRILEKRRRLN